MGRITTVWMVHARTGLNGLKGKLSIEDAKVVFHPETTRTGDTILRFDEIRKVIRRHGTPVIEMHVSSSRVPGLIGFYFVQPPDLTERVEAGLNPFKRHSARKAAIRKLRLGNKLKKDEIDGWLEAVEQARTGGSN